MNEFVGILFTADSVRDDIVTRLLSDIVTMCKVEVLHGGSCQFTAKDAESIYPYLIGESFFLSMIRNITLGPSEYYLVEGNSAHTKINLAKGRFRQVHGDIEASGLRYKYRSGTLHELIMRGYTGTNLLDHLNEFRIHSTDTLAETCHFVSICEPYGGPASSILSQINTRVA